MKGEQLATTPLQVAVKLAALASAVDGMASTMNDRKDHSDKAFGAISDTLKRLEDKIETVLQRADAADDRAAEAARTAATATQEAAAAKAEITRWKERLQQIGGRVALALGTSFLGFIFWLVENSGWFKSKL